MVVLGRPPSRRFGAGAEAAADYRSRLPTMRSNLQGTDGRTNADEQSSVEYAPTGALAAPDAPGQDSGAAVDALFVRWQEHGARAARDALVERFLPLARNLARRYVRSSEPLADLVQVASLGLVKALD